MSGTSFQTGPQPPHDPVLMPQICISLSPDQFILYLEFHPELILLTITLVVDNFLKYLKSNRSLPVSLSLPCLSGKSHECENFLHGQWTALGTSVPSMIPVFLLNLLNVILPLFHLHSFFTEMRMSFPSSIHPMYDVLLQLYIASLSSILDSKLI